MLRTDRLNVGFAQAIGGGQKSSWEEPREKQPKNPAVVFAGYGR